MSEDTTRGLNNGDSFEARVLAELAAVRNQLATMDNRLTSVEGRLASVELKVDSLDEKVDRRLQETRPIWEAVLERMKIMDAKFDVHGHDMLELRADVDLLKKRSPPAA